jgi:hypothetical protein
MLLGISCRQDVKPKKAGKKDDIWLRENELDIMLLLEWL